MPSRKFQPSDWKRLSKSESERVRNISKRTITVPGYGDVAPGESIPKRQYENLRYTSAGWKSRSEYDRVARGTIKKYPGTNRDVPHETYAFRVWSKRYAESHNLSLQRVRAPDSPFMQDFQKAYRGEFTDHTADGPLARILISAGLRQPGWEWDVGDTPSSK